MKGTRKNVVAGWDKADGANVVVVTQECLDALIGSEVPQLDGHVCAARRQHFTLTIESQILHRVCVALQCPLKIPRFKVPNFNSGVLRG